MPLDRRAREFLLMLHRIDAPRMHELPIEIARRNFDKMLFLYRGDAHEAVAANDMSIPRREHAGGALPVRIYRPASVGAERVPAMLWLHGGGWSLGNVNAYDPFCRALAEASGVVVVALEYRLAPEHRFPAALDDAWEALRWLRREFVTLNVDPARIAVGGDSAGGNLAASLALMARDAGIVLAHQLLIYPAVDCLEELHPGMPYANQHFLDIDGLRWFRFNYLAAEADRRDWRASPARAPNHAGVAPALVITAECDLLTASAAAYAHTLAQAGVATRYREMAGTIHGFMTFPRIFPVADDVIRFIASTLRESFGLQEDV
jgi:acetyl esterase